MISIAVVILTRLNRVGRQMSCTSRRGSCPATVPGNCGTAWERGSIRAEALLLMSILLTSAFGLPGCDSATSPPGNHDVKHNAPSPSGERGGIPALAVGAAKADVVKQLGRPRNWFVVSGERIAIASVYGIGSAEQAMPDNERWLFEYVLQGKPITVHLEGNRVVAVVDGNVGSDPSYTSRDPGGSVFLSLVGEPSDIGLGGKVVRTPAVTAPTPNVLDDPKSSPAPATPELDLREQLHKLIGHACVGSVVPLSLSENKQAVFCEYTKNGKKQMDMVYLVRDDGGNWELRLSGAGRAEFGTTVPTEVELTKECTRLVGKSCKTLGSVALSADKRALFYSFETDGEQRLDALLVFKKPNGRWVLQGP